MKYADLKTMRKALGPEHPDVLDRAGKAITKFVRNFSGLAYVFRKVLTEEYEVPVQGAPLRRRSWYWPRNYYFNYPREFGPTWHRPYSEWKRGIMSEYCTAEQMARALSRYELFCIQKKMDEEDILNLGW